MRGLAGRSGDSLRARQKTTSTSSIHFANFDGVRAIAVLMVVVAHIELTRGAQNSLYHLGFVGVSAFFVLSGFLITYLLLQERVKNNAIDFRKFYLRRALRIWPLYFLVLFFATLVIPRTVSLEAFSLSVLLLPNVAYLLHLLPAMLMPTWSIGAEEQFYAIFPQLLRLSRMRYVLCWILGYFLLLLVYKLAVLGVPDRPGLVATVNAFLFYNRFHSMLIGAVAAIMLSRHRVQPAFQAAHFRLFLSKGFQVVVMVSFLTYLICICAGVVPAVYDVVILFAGLVITNMANDATSVINLDVQPLKYLGKISYGIYLVHEFPLRFAETLIMKWLTVGEGLARAVLYYVVTVGLTVIIAGLLHKYYESYFLRLKSRWRAS